MITFIGDVHGWLDRLERILDQAEGELIFLGDLIDRGPDSAAVVQRVRALCDEGRARCILGNHEFAMVRSLGIPEWGIPADDLLYQNWLAFYGGAQTAASYGYPSGGVALRQATHRDALWMVDLPWYIEGRVGARRFLAVHIGLDARPWRSQLLSLEDNQRFFQPTSELPADLYLKDRARLVPPDLPVDVCIISGHVPMAEPFLTPQRIGLDTSGGLPNRRLTALIWPEGRIIHS
jgi:hypothetical protein